jgi:RNA polymerase sigma factor (sigma-70 family)
MASPERPLEEASIEDLVGGLRDASREAADPYCRELIRRFEPLLRKAARHLPRHVEYQDFVQDVFVRLFGGLPNLRDARAFPGYFQRIVQSTVATALRTSPPHTTPLEEVVSEALATRLDHEILAAVFLQSYLHLLSPRERSVLQMEWVDGLGPTEIAAKLGISRGGLSAAKSRAISRLQGILTREASQLERRGPTR